MVTHLLCDGDRLGVILSDDDTEKRQLQPGYGSANQTERVDDTGGVFPQIQSGDLGDERSSLIETQTGQKAKCPNRRKGEFFRLRGSMAGATIRTRAPSTSGGTNWGMVKAAAP